jgi:hypothetical protein
MLRTENSAIALRLMSRGLKDRGVGVHLAEMAPVPVPEP